MPEIVKFIEVPDYETDENVPVPPETVLFYLFARSGGLYVIDQEGTITPVSSDAGALHVGTAGEIASVTEKATPVGDDLAIIEDSAASNAKKRSKLSSILSAVGATIFAALDHASRHGWLEDDELDIKDNFLDRVYPYIKVFDNIDGFTASHTNTGAFTTGWPIAVLTTGATNNSRGCVYATSGIYVYTTSEAYYTRFKVRIHTTTASINTACTIWLGMLTNPTAPTATEKHVAFKIVNGDVYASCGDGTNGNLVDTGINFSQYSSFHLEIRQSGTSIYYYINSVLVHTMTTYAPTGALLNATLYIINGEGVAKAINVYPLMVVQGA